MRDYPRSRGTVKDLLIGDLFTVKVDRGLGAVRIAVSGGAEASRGVFEGNYPVWDQPLYY